MAIRKYHPYCVAMLLLAAVPVMAEDLTIDAAVGGALGGAIGGAIGAEVGGRDGAIVGAGIGAATGAAINTRDHAEGDRHPIDHDAPRPVTDHAHPHGNTFCPPGQAKKGRC
ncbi:MAG: glycine zipper domain-containing protein [Gammaproteobacteria bacterium]